MKNLLQNSSFDMGRAYWENSNIQIVPGGVDGRLCAKWNSAGNYENFLYAGNGYIPIKVVQNTNYTISFYFKASGSSHILNLQINSTSSYGTNIASLTINGTSDVWTRKTLTFNSGANSDIYVRLYDQNYAGVMYLDHFQLEEGSSATDYEYAGITEKRVPVGPIDKEVLGSGTWFGANIPWLSYETAGETAHDGYADGFQNAYFNGTNGNASLQNQLALLADNDIKFIRVWLQMYHNMNTDKATVGYTNFINGFLTNLATYLDWCHSEGIKVCLCIDDGWYTFPWSWINDQEKRNSYIQACIDIVNAVKDKPAMWGFDYANEPYQGWSDTTTHTHNNQSNDIGYNRDYLTAFFTELYTELKTLAPSLYFSVGDAKYSDVRDYGLSACCDYYQNHFYYSSPESFIYKADMYDKPCMVGEWGYGDSNNYMNNIPFNEVATARMFSLGYDLHLLWSASQILERTGTATYAITKGIQGFQKFL